MNIDNKEKAPFVSHSETSRLAAESIEESAATLRGKIYQWLLTNGPATDEQIQDLLGMPGNTERPRRRELQSKGLVVDSGQRGLTSSGRQAVKWSAVK